MSRNKITTIEDYQKYFKGTQPFVEEMENIQTDIDYDVCLSQIYSKWRKFSQLVFSSNLGKIGVKDFYNTIFKNSGITSQYTLTYVDKILMTKMNEIRIKKYDVNMTGIPYDDGSIEEMIKVEIEMTFGFESNTFVNSMNYVIELIIDNSGLYDSINIWNKHDKKCTLNNSFFTEIEKDSDYLIYFINNILPYSVEYYKGEMPALFIDTFVENSEEDEEDEDDLDNDDDEN